jgi:hypothetical protein
MDEILTRFIENMGARVTGPMKLRLIMQPLMASIFAVRSGLADARAGKPAYLWSLFTNAGSRREMLRDGWKSVGKVFVIALILDAIYQLITVRFIYPLETLVTALLLAIVPYLILRGLVSRLASKKR